MLECQECMEFILKGVTLKMYGNCMESVLI